MNVLGLSFGHDGSAAIVRDGKLVAAITTERLTRFKKHRGVTREVLRYVLQKANLQLNNIDIVIVGNWHWDTHIDRNNDFARKGENGFALVEPNGQPWSVDSAIEIFTKANYSFSKPLRILIDGHEILAFAVEHELAHAAYAYFSSPFDDAVALSIDCGDGFGHNHGIYVFAEEIDTAMPAVCLKRTGEFHAGSFYSTLTDYLGFYPSLTDAGKVMALAAYGKPVEGVDHIQFDFNRADDVFGGDGYLHTLVRCGARRFPRVRALYPQLKGEGGVPDPAWLDKKDWSSELSTRIAATAQHILEREILKLCETIARDTRQFSRNLVLSGGTALNCVCNGKILNSGLFDNVYLAPACGDDGLSIGGALLASRRMTRHSPTMLGWGSSPKQLHTPLEVFEGGRRYSDSEVRQAIERVGSTVVARRLDEPTLLKEAVDAIEAGKIVGWFYRGSELGPRALGHRSLIADPRRADMKDILNLRVKHREPFRPFAPVIPIEYAHDWFDIPKGSSSPFMLFSVKCFKPEKIPSAVHIDNTARLQTVDEANNDRFYRLVKQFGERTGVPVVLNTSFNVQGEPIVETPDDAIRCFRGTNIDLLVLEDWILTKAV